MTKDDYYRFKQERRAADFEKSLRAQANREAVAAGLLPWPRPVANRAFRRAMARAKRTP